MNKLVFKTCLLKGEAGNNIESIEKTATSGLTDTYTVTLTDGTTSTFEVTNGSTVDHIDRTGIYETYDEYTMYMTDGTSATFEVPHGPNGTFENFAVVEPNNTASRAYVKGQFLVYNGRLCVVTAAIAAGNTLTIGTNIAQTDVGTQLTTLDNRNIMYSSTEDNIQVRKNGSWQKPSFFKVIYDEVITPTATHSTINLNFTTTDLINANCEYFYVEVLYKSSVNYSFYNSHIYFGFIPKSIISVAYGQPWTRLSFPYIDSINNISLLVPVDTRSALTWQIGFGASHVANIPYKVTIKTI